jgi:hypothetical protein
MRDAFLWLAIITIVGFGLISVHYIIGSFVEFIAPLVLIEKSSS